MKKIAFYTLIIAIAFTLLSPKFFTVYFEKPTSSNDNTVSFGGPIPYLNQTVQLSDKLEDYPLEVKFQSIKETKTSFSFVPFLFSIIITFILLFSIFSLFIRFMTRGVQKEDK